MKSPKMLTKIKYIILQLINILIEWFKGSLYKPSNTLILNCSDKLERNFGYYDLKPQNSTFSYIILTSKLNMKKPFCSDKTNIEIYDKNMRFIKTIATTNLWNSQLGSRITWDEKLKDIIYYLELVDGNINTVKYNWRLNTKTYYECSFFCHDYINNGFYCLNYDRLFKSRPGYGYLSSSLKSDLESDGLFFFKLKTKERKLLVSYSEILKKINLKSNDLHDIRINHIMPSPNKNLIFFLLRYKFESRNISKAILYDNTKNDFKVLNDFGDVISHSCWRDNNNIILWCNTKKNNLPAFYNYNLKINNFYNLDIFRDGHPSMIDDNNILCDTYNNKARQRELFKYNIKKRQKVMLGKYYSSFNYHNTTRTDLHPRVINNGKNFLIDVSFNGFRQLVYGKI